MADSTNFISEQWLNEMAANMGEKRALFEPLGSIDCTMVLVVNDSSKQDLIEVKFRSYGVESVRRLASLEDADPDHFSVSATRGIWCEMFDNIISNGHPDLEHTLNYLTFPDEPILVDGPDQLQIDAFYRYNQSLQLFFNGAADVMAAA